jgi:ribosomal-protein-alanine N-acetyltransferase
VPAGSFDFGPFPSQHAERLTLCELHPASAEDVFTFRGDPEVQLYNSAPCKDVEETRAFIEQERTLYRQKREVIWGLRWHGTGRIIGSVSLFDWDRYHRHAGIGYDLARAYWGQGIAREAIRAVLGFGFEHLALRRIEIWTSAANERSLRLAERLGFERDGTLRKRILEDDGERYDCAVFGLLASEWARLR